MLVVNGRSLIYPTFKSWNIFMTQTVSCFRIEKKILSSDHLPKSGFYGNGWYIGSYWKFIVTLCFYDVFT